LIASACAAGQDQHLIPPSPGLGYGGYGGYAGYAGYAAPSVLSGVVGPSVYSSRILSPSVLSGVVGPSVYGAHAIEAPAVLSAGVVARPAVLSAPAVVSAPVAVARPAAVAVEHVSYGSVPSVSVVNEPTSIVAPGRPIRGHTFSSEVRHDSRVALAAPAVAAFSAPVAVAAPAVASFSAPAVAALPSAATYSYGVPSVAVSAPRVLATGPASVVAGPVSVRGYSLETGRTDLVSEVRHRVASIPAQVVQDTVVESAPLVASAPLIRHGLFGAPVWSSAWKK
jgi:hypothetical protein